MARYAARGAGGDAVERGEGGSLCHVGGRGGGHGLGQTLAIVKPLTTPPFLFAFLSPSSSFFVFVFLLFF